LIFVGPPPSAAAAEVRGATPQDVTLLDSDNFARGFHAPSMEQAVSWSAAFYEASHRSMRRRWQILLFDFVADAVVPLPLSDTWVHEEFHRAVLQNRGVPSFDDVYRIRFNPGSIAVSHVRDENLVRMKRDHPADFVRAHEAGIEGEHALVLRLEKEHFFDGAKSWNLPLYWFAKTNSIAYIMSGSTSAANRAIDRWERQEGTSISRRDFTGHDFTAWVYDLFRPDEPYTSRGVHPSGVGLRRYIRESDLTDAERAYLHRQGRLAILNLIDPNLIELSGKRFNAAAAHVLTPFGYTIDLDAFIRPKLFIALHDYRNGQRNFPGVEASLADRFRIALWEQPAHMLFRDRGGRVGGLVSVRVHRRSMFAEIEAKSAGWVEGNVHLDRSISVRAGFSRSLHHIGRAIRADDAARDPR